MEKIRVFTAFSGYDSQCLSLDRLKKKYPEFDYELVGWSEIDKYAIQAHNAIYPQWADRNYGDISKINWDEVPDFDLFTYSSPCQDFSNAGLQKGGEEGSGTRSSLLWECRRAIVAKKPKFLLMENVAALVSQKFIKTFNKWQEELARYGYSNFAQVLNAKDYGIPQNRERIFLVSVLGEAWYNFPQPFKLEKRLKDVLETNVDEKYYLSEKILKGFERTSADNFIKEVGRISSSQNSRVINPDGIYYAMTNSEKDGAPKIVEQCDTKENISTPTKVSTGMSQIDSTEDNLGGGISRTVKTTDSLAVMEESILIPEATAKGYAEATDGDSVNLEQPNSKTRRGRVGKQMANTLTTSCNQGVVVSEPKAVSYTRDSKGKTQNKHLIDIVNTIHSSTGSGGNTDCFVAEPKVQQIGNIVNDTNIGFKNPQRGRVYSTDGLSPCLYCFEGGGLEPKIQTRYRIRKLTPRECFRLMDVDENVIDTIQAAGISNSQQYKMAGNSIVVACLEKIFEQMFFSQYTNSRTLFG